MDRFDQFFATARERHSIYLHRLMGTPPPWTEDPIFLRWRFCNVFRELDKTTSWFRAWVRERLRYSPEVLLATVVFRFFNRITTGEAIFNQLNLDGLDLDTAWDRFLVSGKTEYLRSSIIAYIGDRGPYVTGSYIVKTPEGYSKLDGVLWILEEFYKGNWRQVGERALENGEHSLQQHAEWLEAEHDFVGHFTAYEIVSDLRHTDLLCHAPDILDWANPGPGATRGLNHLHGREIGRQPPRSQLMEEMRELLYLSRDAQNWPREWPAWEMREVEHWLCEHAKYVRARDTGQGTRQRFRT